MESGGYFATVRNETARLPSKCQDGCMLKKESDNATRASIKKEMAKPRMAKSVRKAELNLATERVPGQARVTLAPESSTKSSRLCVRSNRKRHRLLWPGRTTGIEISVLKIA